MLCDGYVFISEPQIPPRPQRELALGHGFAASSWASPSLGSEMLWKCCGMRWSIDALWKLPEPWDLINLRNTKTQFITCSRRVETYWRSGSWRSRKWSRTNWSATCSPWSCWRIEAGTLSGYALYYKAMRSASVTARFTLEMGSMHSLNSTINWLGLNFWFNELQAGVNYPRDKFDQSLIIERLGDIFPYLFHIFSFRSFDTSRFNGQTKSLPLWSPAEPIASTHSHHFQSQVSLLCHYYVITMSLLHALGDGILHFCTNVQKVMGPSQNSWCRFREPTEFPRLLISTIQNMFITFESFAVQGQGNCSKTSSDRKARTIYVSLLAAVTPSEPICSLRAGV